MRMRMRMPQRMPSIRCAAGSFRDPARILGLPILPLTPSRYEFHREIETARQHPRPRLTHGTQHPVLCAWRDAFSAGLSHPDL